MTNSKFKIGDRIFKSRLIVGTGKYASFEQTREAIELSGAEMVTVEELFERADMIIKVKEPQPAEWEKIRPGQIIFTYFHFAASRELTEAMMQSGATCVAYETLRDHNGRLPLLTPMSEVAGRMSIQAGAHCLEMYQGGRGALLGGVAGVPAADVLILGGGVVGSNAARIAIGSEARVTVIDLNLRRLKDLDDQFSSSLNTIYSTVDTIEKHLRTSDLVIGAVLVPGAAAPRLVTEEMIKGMRKGAVVVDVAIDQGGCVETARPTTHDDPTYKVHDVVHYCVANMPGAVARTSTFALNNATMPFMLALADKGYAQAARDDPHLKAGLNVHAGEVTYEAVARDLNLNYRPVDDALAGL